MRDPDQGLVEARPAIIFLYILFALLTSGASIYTWAGHTSHVFWWAGVLLAIFLGPCALALFRRCPITLRRVLSSWVFLFAGVIALTTTDLVRYHPPGRNTQASTAAPALVEPAVALAHGHDPYEVRLAGDAPISPGPGWIILLAPVTLAGGVASLMGVVLGLCVYLLWRRRPESAGLFLGLVLLQPVLLAQSIAAHDIFMIPIFFGVLCLLAERWVDSPAKLIVLGAVAAAFATSRIPMVALLLILCLGLFRLRARAGLLFAAVSLTLTALLHAGFYLWARRDHVYYQPLHVFSRGTRPLNHALQAVGLCSVLLVGAFVLLKMSARSSSWIACAGLFLAAAFVPVGLGEARFIMPHYVVWEGANYVSFGASLLALAIVLHVRPAPLEQPQGNPMSLSSAS